MTEEFLLVDLLNNLDHVAEDRKPLLERVRTKALSLDDKKLLLAANKYGKIATRKFFHNLNSYAV